MDDADDESLDRLEDIWRDVKPGQVLKRQGELQREVNANVRSIAARRAELERALVLADARWKSFLDHEFADHEKRIVSLEAEQHFWADDGNVEDQVARLGLVRLTEAERAVFTQDIADKVWEKGAQERARKKTRLMDQWWARAVGYTGAFWIGYQLLFGQTPLVPAIRHVLGMH